jgi:hypothetical protein
MSQTITLELPDRVAKIAWEFAARKKQPVQKVLLEWLDEIVNDLPVNALSDEQVLALCDTQMDHVMQEKLSRLLEANREGTLSAAKKKQLDEVMEVYKKGMVRKAEALKVAVERGLRPAMVNL